MRNEWNGYRDWNMGPRGPYCGRRAVRRPAGGGLLTVFGLLIGFRLVLAALAIAGVMISAVFSGLAAVFSGVVSAAGTVFSDVFSSVRTPAGIAVGIAIGLIVYRMIRAKKEEEAA